MTTEPPFADLPDSGARPWLLIALLLAGFFALSAATLLLPHDPYIRYQQLGATIQYRTVRDYERTAFDPAPIDVAVIGNSRMQSAVSAPDLTRQLSASLGRSVQVENISLPQEGRDAHYAIARRLLESHPETRLIVLSAIEQMPRESHPAFRYIADSRDILAAPALINRSYVENIAFLPYRQMALFVQSLAPQAFGHRAQFDPAAYAAAQEDTTRSFTTATGNRVERERIVPEAVLRPAANARIASITPPVLPDALADLEFPVERHYTRRIVDLARANGTEVVFLYLPVYAHPIPLGEADFYAPLGPILAADFVAGQSRSYSDYGHLNTNGSRQVTRWLGEEIVRRGLLDARRQGGAAR